MRILCSLALALVCAQALSLTGCSSAGAEGNPASSEGQLVGGVQESRWRAVGYLTHSDEESGVACGATLIAPNVVVTAAHCAYRHRDHQLAFGVGDVAARTRVRVVEVHYHPSAHLERQGVLDVAHALLLNDLAYLVLERAVDGVQPAKLPSGEPERGCGVELVGYGDGDAAGTRTSVEGCVLVGAQLGTDSIVEIRPALGGAVCHRDGDEGHGAILPASDGAPVLVGIYVGSVTQSVTDCVRYTQLLNGYETSAGHLDFYEEGIRRGAALLTQ
jgi:secreted trypsin-like serine protease